MFWPAGFWGTPPAPLIRGGVGLELRSAPRTGQRPPLARSPQAFVEPSGFRTCPREGDLLLRCVLLSRPGGPGTAVVSGGGRSPPRLPRAARHLGAQAGGGSHREQAVHSSLRWGLCPRGSSCHGPAGGQRCGCSWGHSGRTAELPATGLGSRARGSLPVVWGPDLLPLPPEWRGHGGGVGGLGERVWEQGRYCLAAQEVFRAMPLLSCVTSGRALAFSEPLVTGTAGGHLHRAAASIQGPCAWPTWLSPP